MFKIIWLPNAEKDLTGIVDYIAEENPTAAYETALKIHSSARNIANYPYIGKIGRVNGTRELIIPPNYILPYRIKNNEIHILNIFHTARKWPKRF